jgi:hypothetical protein
MLQDSAASIRPHSHEHFTPAMGTEPNHFAKTRLTISTAKVGFQLLDVVQSTETSELASGTITLWLDEMLNVCTILPVAIVIISSVHMFQLCLFLNPS